MNSRSIISGFAATAVMLFAFVGAYAISLGLAGVDLVARRGAADLRGWFHGLTNNQLIDLGRDNLYVAAALFLLGGIVWAVIYAEFVEPRLGGPGWLRGIKFAFIPWALSLIIFLPLVGGGFLGMNLGAGPLPIIGNLLLHLTYGATLGLLYGPFGDRVMEAEPTVEHDWESAEETVVLHHSEAIAARGMLVGLIVGVVVGAVATIVAMAGNTLILGTAPISFGLATAIMGAALGGLVGSLAGLPSGGEFHGPLHH